MARTHLSGLFVLLVLVAGGSAMAQKGFVTVIDQNVGPGMRYRKMVDTAAPWSLDLFEADLTNPYLLLESCKGHEILRRWQVSSGSREATSSMARRNQRAGHRVVAAINADFFNTAPYTGEPVNIQVERGEMVCMPIDRSTIGFTPENRPLLERYTFSATPCIAIRPPALTASTPAGAPICWFFLTVFSPIPPAPTPGARRPCSPPSRAG